MRIDENSSNKKNEISIFGPWFLWCCCSDVKWNRVKTNWTHQKNKLKSDFIQRTKKNQQTTLSRKKKKNLCTQQQATKQESQAQSNTIPTLFCESCGSLNKVRNIYSYDLALIFCFWNISRELPGIYHFFECHWAPTPPYFNSLSPLRWRFGNIWKRVFVIAAITDPPEALLSSVQIFISHNSRQLCLVFHTESLSSVLMKTDIVIHTRKMIQRC